jgi:hypothetical protein
MPLVADQVLAAALMVEVDLLGEVLIEGTEVLALLD